MARNDTTPENQAIIDLMKDLGSPRSVAIADDDHKVKSDLLFVPTGMQSIDVEKYLAPLRARPRRRIGTHVAFDIQSFVGLVNRFKDPASVVFADCNLTDPSLTAVLNFHEAGGDTTDPAANNARHGDHRVTYAFPLSKEYKHWRDQNGKPMTQADFAHFIEDRIAEIAMPEPQMLGTLGERQAGGDFGARTPTEELIYLAWLTKGTFATPQHMVELARGMEVRENLKVKEVRNLQSGEAQVQYETEHLDQEGAPLTVPTLFLIEIPIFEAGVLYRLAARLRYRLAAGKLLWLYELHRLERAFDHAIKEACEKVGQDTGVPLYLGKAGK